VRNDLLPATDFSQIFNTVLLYLQLSCTHDVAVSAKFSAPYQEKSILNYPPLNRPPVLNQDCGNHDALLHGAFERRVKDHPDRIALDFLESRDLLMRNRRTYTYQEVDNLATALAQRIIERTNCQGSNVSKVVPILLSTSPELYISYIAVLKTGMAFCPLPVEAPAQRVQDIIEDLRPGIIIGSENFKYLLHKNGNALKSQSESTAWIDVEDFVQTQADVSVSALTISGQETDVAYVMYTSGSTGKPKGVQITHLASTCSIAAHAVTSPLPPASDGIPRWFQFAAPTFDPSLMEIFVALSTGATLCSATRLLTLTDVEGTVSELGATVMMSTPSMAAVLRLKNLPSVRSLWTMGETLLRKNIDEFASTGSFVELCNAYGPTEAAINCTLLPNFHPEDRGSIIGPALSTCSLFIIDPSEKLPTPVPRGLAGELAIGGPQVSVGYMNREEQNIKSFVESPEFGRLYRTGDKARMVTDRQGNYVIEFLGRLDTSQVKLSGRRVDLGDIDSIIVKCPGVQEVVTVSYKRFMDQHGSEEAVSFLTSDDKVDRLEVEATCRATVTLQLPSYMCPSRYFFLNRIPRSLAGKVDRKALSAMVDQLWDGDDNISENSSTIATSGNSSATESGEDSALEDLLCTALAQITGTKTSDITKNTNLFSVGIDSLRAMRYLQQLRDLGVNELSIVDILRSATPQVLVKIIEGRRLQVLDTVPKFLSENSSKPVFSNDLAEKYKTYCAEQLVVKGKDIERILPTTATQSGMLASFLRSSANDDNRKHYIHHSIHHINSSINTTRLQESWMTVLDRHEAYRTVFLPIDDKMAPFLQCVLALSSPRASKSWDLQICEGQDESDLGDAISTALKIAEGDIAIDRPPLKLTLISGSENIVVIFSIFHGIFDGASLQLLFEEVSMQYYQQDIPPRTEMSVAVDMHFNADLQSTVEFWSTKSKDCDPMPFPCLTGLRPDIITKAPQTTTILAAITLNVLRDRAKDLLSSPLAILQAAWSLLLVTYKDSLNSSTFGSVISGRLDHQSSICMAPTFTTIPITIPSSLFQEPAALNSTVTQFLTQLNAQSLMHLQIPLNAIVSSHGSLLYDTLLAFQEFSTGSRECGLWNKVDYPPMCNDFAVMIEIWPEENGHLQLRATYTDEHLDGVSANLMLQQFSDIISFIVENPDQLYLDGRFATVSSRTPMEKQPSQSLDSNNLLHGQFERNAALNPGDVALIFKQDLNLEITSTVEWTYQELNDRANQLALYLIRSFGPLNNLVVPFCIEKSPDLYVAVLAILKVGAAWCPIDPTFPPDRRHDLISRTDAKVLLVANHATSDDKRGVPANVILLDIHSIEVPSPEVSMTSEGEYLPTPKPQDTAYLIWTSGTTGMPKGVQVQHHSAATSMRSLQNLIETSKKGTVRCLQFSQPTFDVFVQDLFYTWGLRGTVISATKEIMLGSFAELANQTQATHAHLTPAFATIIPRKTIQTMEVVTMIGEALPQPVADDWACGMMAYNTYGPAEVSVVSTVRQFGGLPNNFKSTNIGYPLPSVSTYIVNDNKVTMKHGVGELALGGPQVARGYWKDVDKTNEKFHWNEAIGEHIYLTGDIVRQLHDGSLEFVGRRDDLVKLSGIRVELSEISFALSHCHPAVEQVVTMHMGRPDRPNKVVVAFLSAPCVVNLKRDHPVTNEIAVEIANTAMTESRRTLPEHMVPSVFIVINSIPVTASAKIDRKALRTAYEQLNLEEWENMISPTQASDWSDTERLIVEQVCEFSGTALLSIGRKSRLAALGIDSIASIRLTARLKAAGWDISTMSLLQSRTVDDLCKALEVPIIEISQNKGLFREIEEFHEQWYPEVSQHLDSALGSFSVFPALPLQDNLLSETFRNYESYWSSHFFCLDNTINLDQLQKAWALVAKKNEALRVGYIATAAATSSSTYNSPSTFLQILYDEPTVQWKLIDGFSDYPAVAKARAREIALEAQQTSFLMPCWAISIINKGESRVMMFTIHHSIHDGPSLDFIIQDLYDAYTSDLPLTSRSQLRAAVAIYQSSTDKSDECNLFWKNTLKEFTTVEDENRVAPVSEQDQKFYHTSTIPLSVPFEDLQMFAQRLQLSSAASILRAAWACTVADLLEAVDKHIILGEVLSERLSDSSLDDMIGPLVSLVPAPVCITGSATEIVSKHDDTMVSSWKYRSVYPGFIRQLTKRSKNLPLYPAVFVFHPQSEIDYDHSNVWIKAEDIIGLNVEHQLTLNVEQRSDRGIDLLVSAEASILSLERTNLLAEQLNALISAMIMHPDEPVSQLTNYFPRELISITNKRELTLEYISSLDNPLCWFEHWARVHPDWIAAEVAEEIRRGSTSTSSWTYAELNEKAGQVAAFIESHGICRQMIGMSLGRTLSAFAVTLGIFMSGNTYLPIDEDLPKERKAFLLQDGNAAMFFSTGLIDFAPPCCKIIDVDNDEYMVQRIAPTTVTKNPDDVAYLLYTSGSTGTPKGVLISNANLSAFCEAQSEFICANVPSTMSLGGTGKYLCLASRAFDVHVGEMFLAWRHGLCAVTGNRSMLLDDLPLALKELQVSHASFVPSLLDQVGLVPADVPLLKYMGVGGEKISQRTLETFGDSDTVALINAYGPTEATIGCCSAAVSSRSNMRNIGRPLGDVVAHVLIPGTLIYTKRGMEGELCLTGSLVGVGYHHRETGAFVGDFNGEKMYRTGDLVRLMPDDTIEIFGRSDDQTKIRGQRLELGEVSECVRTLSAEDVDVVSIIMKHPELSRMQLVAFLSSSKAMRSGETPVLLSNFHVVNETIRNGCKEALPAYMVPDLVIPISFLPLAATSGKADIKLLKSIFASIPLITLVSTDSLISSTTLLERAPTDDEQRVAELLKRVVASEQMDIKPSTNIFEIGVDSLVAISLSTLMRKAGYECSVSDVLGLTTVEDLASLPHTRDSGEAISSRLDSARAKISMLEAAFRDAHAGTSFNEKIETVRPCLPVQEAIIARSFDKDYSSYVNHIILELNKKIDMRRLRATWVDTVRENDILRTCFCYFNNDILQVVLRDNSTSLLWDNTTDVDGLNLLKDMQARIAKDVVSRIECVPPIRINVVTPISEEGKTLMCLSMHHALYDAESLSSLLNEVQHRYEAQPFPERPSAGVLVEYVASVDGGKARDYWTSMLQGHIPLRPGTSNHIEQKEARLATRVLKTHLSSLELHAARLRVTLPTLAQTLFGLAMAKVTHTNDFVFGLVLSGRSVPVLGIENVLAPSITTVPQRIDLRHNNTTILDVLSSVQRSSGKIIQFQHTSLREIHKWIEADRPLFNCLFSYVKPITTTSPMDLWTEVESYMPPDYPIAVEFEANTELNQLIVRAGYTPEFGSLLEVNNILEMIELLLDAVCNGENVKIESLGIEAQVHNMEELKDSDHSQTLSPQEVQIKDVLYALGGFELMNISRHATFFRLGIDSVISIRFAQKLRAAGLEVSSSDIARHPSIAQLSDYISSKKQTVIEEIALPTMSLLESYRDQLPLFSYDDNLVEIYPCTPLQTGLLTQTITTDGTLYVHHPTVELSADINISRLKRAWASVVSSLDILRTSFHYIEAPGNQWIAAVHSHSEAKWVEFDTEDDINNCIKQIARDTTFPSPEAFSSPPVQVTIFKSSSTTTMTVSLHHSLYDGWSLPLFFKALSEAYTEKPKIESSLMPPFYLAAKRIAESQDESVKFSYNQVSSYKGINLPVSQNQGHTSFSNFVLSFSTRQALEKCKDMNINLQSAALLAYGKTLCCLVKRRDIVFGHVVSGRSLDLADVESIAGPLFNTIPFRIQLDNPLLTNINIASRVQRKITDGQDFQHASLNAIQKLWRQSQEDEGALIDALFVFQKTVEYEDVEHTLWKPYNMADDRNSTEYGLNIELEQGQDEIVLSAASSRLNDEDLNAFCRTFDSIFNDILESPYRSVTAFPDVLHSLPLLLKTVIKAKDDFADIETHPALQIVREAFIDVSSIPIEKISLQTSIWSMGIDSIAAIRVASMCRRQGLQLSVADVLQGRCLGGIVRIAVVKGVSLQIEAPAETPEITAEAKKAVLSQIKYPESGIEVISPCLAGQIYHLVSWLNSGRTSYEPTWTFVSSVRIDAKRLSIAWQTLQSKHAILRTIFSVIGASEAYQVVLREDAIDSPRFTISQTKNNLEQVVKQEVSLLSEKPADLFTPPINLHLVQGEDQDAILVRIHHSLYDAWTMTSLINELSNIYLEQPVPSSPSFTDFVWHIQRTLNTSSEKLYWHSALAHGQRAILSQRARPLFPPLKQTFVWIKGAIKNLKHITQLCQRSSVALSTIVILAFSRAIGQQTQTTNPIFGFFQAARSADFAETQDLKGPCVNLLPFAVPIGQGSDLETGLAIQEELSRRVPYEQSYLQDVIKYQRGIDVAQRNPQEPLFNASLNLLWHGKHQSVLAEDPLLKPLYIGVPSDFASDEPFPGQTAVDGLETRYLAMQNLFCDVGPVEETDTIDFGVKCDFVLMDEAEVEAFVGIVVEEVHKILKQLGA